MIVKILCCWLNGIAWYWMKNHLISHGEMLCQAPRVVVWRGRQHSGHCNSCNSTYACVCVKSEHEVEPANRLCMSFEGSVFQTHRPSASICACTIAGCSSQLSARRRRNLADKNGSPCRTCGRCTCMRRCGVKGLCVVALSASGMRS